MESSEEKENQGRAAAVALVKKPTKTSLLDSVMSESCHLGNDDDYDFASIVVVVDVDVEVLLMVLETL